MKTEILEQSVLDIRTTFGKALVAALCVLMVACLVFIQTASAQDRGRPGKAPSPERVMAKLTERLNLTEEQKVQMQPVIKDDMEKHRDVMTKAREQEIKDREAVRAQFEAIDKETDAKLATILSAEQLKEFQKIREERRARMHDKRHRGGPPPFGG